MPRHESVVEFERVLSTQEVCEILQCADSTVRNATMRGAIKPYATLLKTNFYRVQDIWNWVKTRKKTSPCFMNTLTEEMFIQRCKDLGIEYSEF